MKKIILIILTFYVCNSLIAKPVDVDTAKKVALNWYSEKSDINVNNLMITEIFIEEKDSENIFYIFNFENTGFVIVSADDDTIPILCYSLKGNYKWFMTT